MADKRKTSSRKAPRGVRGAGRPASIRAKSNMAIEPVPSSHPTRERLIEVTLRLLDTLPREQVTSDRVLADSGISKGSLYHHFEDFFELLEVALARQFARTVDANIAAIAGLIDQARSADEMYSLIGELFRVTHARERARFRLRRAMLAGATLGNARFQAALAREQDRLTQAMAALFRQAQARGWLSSAVDPHAGAVLVQAYSLGLVVDDVAADRVNPAAWNALIERLLQRLFREP